MRAEILGGIANGSVSNMTWVTSVVKFQRFTTSSRSLQSSLVPAAQIEKIKYERNVWKMTLNFST